MEILSLVEEKSKVVPILSLSIKKGMSYVNVFFLVEKKFKETKETKDSK